MVAFRRICSGEWDMYTIKIHQVPKELNYYNKNKIFLQIIKHLNILYNFVMYSNKKYHFEYVFINSRVCSSFV